METQDAIILRAALETLKGIGSDGTTKKILLAQTESETGIVLTTERAENLMRVLTERRYIAGYLAPITNSQRYRITERGAEALAAL